MRNIKAIHQELKNAYHPLCVDGAGHTFPTLSCRLYSGLSAKGVIAFSAAKVQEFKEQGKKSIFVCSEDFSKIDSADHTYLKSSSAVAGMIFLHSEYTPHEADVIDMSAPFLGGIEGNPTIRKDPKRPDVITIRAQNKTYRLVEGEMATICRDQFVLGEAPIPQPKDIFGYEKVDEVNATGLWCIQSLPKMNVNISTANTKVQDLQINDRCNIRSIGLYKSEYDFCSLGGIGAFENAYDCLSYSTDMIMAHAHVKFFEQLPLSSVEYLNYRLVDIESPELKRHFKLNDNKEYLLSNNRLGPVYLAQTQALLHLLVNQEYTGKIDITVPQVKDPRALACIKSLLYWGSNNLECFEDYCRDIGGCYKVGDSEDDFPLMSKPMIKQLLSYEIHAEDLPFGFNAMIETSEAVANYKKILPIINKPIVGANDLTANILGLSRSDMKTRQSYKKQHGFDPFEKFHPKVLDTIFALQEQTGPIGKKLAVAGRQLKTDPESVEKLAAMDIEIITNPDQVSIGTVQAAQALIHEKNIQKVHVS